MSENKCNACLYRQLAKRYVMQTIAIVAFLTAAAFAVRHFAGVEGMVVPIVIASSFALVIDTADALIWRKVANDWADSLPTFFTAVSGFRMLLGIMTIAVYYFAATNPDMTIFFLTFFAYYIALILHHAIFFARVSAATGDNSKSRINT